MGKLLIVGIGPGNYENMTIRADRALKESQVIVGYTVYVDLVKERYPEKKYLTTPMTREVQRVPNGFGRSPHRRDGGYDLLRRQRCIRHGRAAV